MVVAAIDACYRTGPRWHDMSAGAIRTLIPPKNKAQVYYRTGFSIASERLNLNNPTQGTQCGDNKNPTTQRPKGTRQ